jgi:HlyD family secretion protein
MWRWVWILILLIVVAGGVALAMQPRGVPVDVAFAERKEIREYVEEQAKTRLPDVYEITMPLQGRVLPITLNEGDRVTAGQIVAQLDPQDLETDVVERANTVVQYDRSLEQIDLAIEQAEQTVLASQASYDFAERQFSRSESLRSQNTVSQATLEADELRMTESKLELRKNQLNKSIYVIMRNIVELMRETDMAKRAKAQRDLDRAVLRSPVDGVILVKQVSNERVLSAGTVLLEIGDLQTLQVEAEILTQDVVKIQVGDQVDIEGPAIGVKPVAGRVAQVYPQGFTKVSSLGVEQQRVIVVMDFEPGVLERLREERRTLGVDYRVRVKVYTGYKPEALVIPRAALFRSAAGRWQVFVVRDGVARRVDVEVGLRNDFEVEVLQGLEVGEAVIVAPDSTLEDNATVVARTRDSNRAPVAPSKSGLSNQLQPSS